jgi:hypothetical protein
LWGSCGTVVGQLWADPLDPVNDKINKAGFQLKSGFKLAFDFDSAKSAPTTVELLPHNCPTFT